MKQDCGRLTTENNQLHLKLIQEGERYDQHEKEQYQKHKTVEESNAQLAYWKSQAYGRLRTLETENNDLKQRLADLVKSTEKRAAKGLNEPRDESTKIAQTKPFGEWTTFRFGATAAQQHSASAPSTAAPSFSMAHALNSALVWIISSTIEIRIVSTSTCHHNNQGASCARLCSKLDRVAIVSRI